jgi:peptidyl-prolyl cis-trans isomerase SurA
MMSLKKLTAALFAFFCFTTIFAQPLKGVADKIIAIVGDHIILQSEIQNSINDILRRGGEVSDTTSCFLAEQALISKILMLQAQKDSLPVTDDEVEAELDQLIRYYVKKVGSVKALEEAAGKTISQLKEGERISMKERKLAEAMQQNIIGNVKITPAEVKAFFDRMAKDSLPFYESEMEIGQIIVRPKPSLDMDKYIYNETYYYKKQVEYSVTSFAQLAAKVSEDIDSKERGGLYEVDRNDKTWDPALQVAIFKLKKGEISLPIRTKLGFHLIQLVEKDGDKASIRQILRIPPVTQIEVDQAISRLEAVRSKITSGAMGFIEAAVTYIENESTNSSVYLFGRDGSPRITIDQLDKEMTATISKMKVGDISQPVVFPGENGQKEVRLVYLKSRTEPHRMNLKDDYSKVSQMALDEKRNSAEYLDTSQNSRVLYHGRQRFFCLLSTGTEICQQGLMV